MSEDNRISQLEKEVDDLYNSIKSLEGVISGLNISIALLDQLMKEMRSEKEKRDSFSSRVQFFIVGSLISAVMAFIISGGLSR